MSEKLARRTNSWTFVASPPPREVFAVFEQMCGVPPFRYEVTGLESARIVETERQHFMFGYWRKLELVDGDGTRQWRSLRFPPRWVTVRALPNPHGPGTVVEVEASRGRGALPRALQIIQLLSRGSRDRRTVYRDREIPAGPTTLVASWAGTPYQLYERPAWDAARGVGVLTASGLVALDSTGPFVRVRTADGVEGYIERDQLVPAPSEASREAQPRAAVTG